MFKANRCYLFLFLKIADRYTDALEVQVKVAYNNTRGYHLSIPHMDPLPLGLTQAVRNKKTISCTSEEIASLSDRAAESIANALTITTELLQETIQTIRNKIEALFALSDSIVSFRFPMTIKYTLS